MLILYQLIPCAVFAFRSNAILGVVTLANVTFDDVPTACPIETVTEPVVVSTLTPVPALTAVTFAAVYVVAIELPFHVPLVIVPTVAKFANDVNDVLDDAVILVTVCEPILPESIIVFHAVDVLMAAAEKLL